MLDGFLKPKKHSKCNTRVKLTKTRLEAIRKKRNAVEKFLKNDIADLLRSALDYNAYLRAEGLLVEQNMSSCYELIAKYIGCISDHVRELYKQKDCPDECKEAIPSLMYAAARFSDLPELRDLRTLFTEKFGSSLERYLSKEFVKRLKQDPPSKEMKIQLLRDLAQEFSIRWDSKALEERLYVPPALHEGNAKNDPLSDCDEEKRRKSNDFSISSRGIERETLSLGRKGRMSDASWSWRLQSSDEDETSTENSSSRDGTKASSSLGSVSEDELVELKRPFSNRFVPPPYFKEKSNESESDPKRKTITTTITTESKKPVPRSVRSRPRQPPPGYFDTKSEETAKVDSSERAMNCGDSWDEEEHERRMDGLLMMNYNKKQSPLVRGTSLPPEDQTNSSTKGLALKGRSNSMEPGMMTRAAGNVHPTLPDYDDLSARLASLKGT